MNIQISEKPRSVKIQMSELEESRNREEAMTPQRLVSVDEDSKTAHILFKELLKGLVKLDRAFKIQTGGEQIHLSQIRSQTRYLHQTLQHLLLPMSIYHYSEIAIKDVSLDTRLVNQCYTIYNTRDDDAIYVWSKEYGKHI